MAITPGEFTTEAKTTASTSITLVAPANLVAGDLLYMQCSINGGLVNSAPTGWNQRVSNTGVSNPRVFAYSKVAVAADVGATFIFGLSASITSGSVLRRFSGVDGTTPHDVTAAVLASGAAATSGTVPSLTTATADALLLGGMGINSSSTAITAPTGMTETAEVGGKKHEADFEQRPSAGATGTRTWTFGASREFAGFLDALRPAAGATTASVTATRDTTWGVAAAVSGSRATTWTAHATVAATRGTTWHVVTAVSGTRATTWVVLTPVTASRGTSWAAAVAVTATRETTWAVAGELVAVTATRGTTWHVIGTVTVVQATTWTVAVLVVTNRPTTWAVLQQVTPSRATSWAVAGMVTAARSTSWAVASDKTIVKTKPSFILSRHRLRPVTTQVFF